MTFLHKLAQRLARLKALCAVPVVALIACEKPVLLTGPGGPGAVTRLIVSPKNLTLLPNQTTDLMAVGLTATSDTGSVAVVWSVTGGAIVDTSASGGKHYGRYKSGAPGQYKVVAHGNPGGLSDTATVTVNPVPVASVVVSPAAPSVTVGQTVQLVATPQDSSGTALPGRTVTWASSNGAVGTVSGSGQVVAMAAGSATITATSEGRSGTASISVANIPVATVTVNPASASIS
ncbi:MAG TPA: Ig-like domain-containing protein, partial [Mycobacterium sp.]|nr:Ig-like domain-containing protein [Mycobacterium sp.]